MIRAVSYLLSIIISFTLVLSICGASFGGNIVYDCPATAAARTLEYSGQQKVIEVPISISFFTNESRYAAEELQVQVHWNRGGHSVVDYEPKTALYSKFDGPISVETRKESTIGVGAKASSSALDWITPSINMDAGTKNLETRRFNEIPEHEVLLTSGTSHRGSGAYFHYKKSRTNTLEGSRDLVIAFEVPESWRGGVLQITLTTLGRQRKFASMNSEFEYARVFVVPIYLEGDDQAKELANEFVRSEQKLRRGWELYERQAGSSTNLQKWFGGGRQDIPKLWVHHLIQSGTDLAIDKYESKLPAKVANSAHAFVNARRNLLALSR